MRYFITFKLWLQQLYWQGTCMYNMVLTPTQRGIEKIFAAVILKCYYRLKEKSTKLVMTRFHNSLYSNVEINKQFRLPEYCYRLWNQLSNNSLNQFTCFEYSNLSKVCWIKIDYAVLRHRCNSWLKFGARWPLYFNLIICVMLRHVFNM